MIKYLYDASSRLKNEKRGMESNPTVWQNQPYTPVTLQGKIDLLDAKEAEIEKVNEQLKAMQVEAHALANECEDYADRVEALAIGLEGSSAEKLALYGIKLRKAAVKKSAPSKVLIPSLQDDTDGVGFIVSTQADPDADNYEWHKGIAADATKTDVIPELKYFTITAKTSFVDDDVPKGVRVFYRVRAINRAGQGPWSEAVSRVQ